ncbi:MAG: prolyl oligopeptidase family serine peptidase [bacterium]|nr:prolyl oligopeptidase family serine peptidase [bacterium]
METPITFKNQGMQMIGIIHRPEGKSNCPAVIFYHGFTGNKADAHWVFTKFARKLVEHGIGAFRFDFRHSCDSEGDFSQMTISGEISDAIVAIDYLSVEPWVDRTRIGVFGLSLGGCIAAIVSGRDSRVKSTVLWAPVAKPWEDFYNAGLPKQDLPFEEQSAIYIGAAFREELPFIRPLDEIIKRNRPVLIIHGTEDQTIPYQRGQEFAQALNQIGCKNKLILIPGGDHTFSKKIHEDKVIAESVKWFVETL